jgi:SRSO17 transposase
MKAIWSDEKVLAKVREMVLPAIERHGPIEAWIIDDTGFPKKGRHSVGVARQYCGELGKQDNCQIAVTLSIANHHASLPVAYRIYLPKEWAMDRARRRKAGVPKEVTFKTKSAIALEQLRWACAAGLPRGVVLMDAGYGTDTDLRTNITALGLSYVAGIQPQTSVWAPGTGPQLPKTWSGCGRPPKLLRRGGQHSINAVAKHQREQRIATMAKQKSQRKGAKARSEVKKLSKPARSKAAAKPVGKAKPKREQVKKAARAIASAAEAVAVEVIEQPAPGVLLGQRFRGSNHIRRPRQACRTKCG